MTDRQPPAHLFKPGPDPRRTGRPKGSRNKLAGDFFHDLHGVWEEQGEAVLRRAAFEKPMEFAAMVAKLMPAKLEITTPTSGLTDERFQELMDLAERQLALSASMTIEGSAQVIERGEGSPHEGEGAGEVIEVIHYSVQSSTPSERPAPTATPISRQAETPIEAGPADTPEPDDIGQTDPLKDAEVDVEALFR